MESAAVVRAAPSATSVRMATNADGPQIMVLLCSAGLDVSGMDFIDWHDIYPYWLVAEQAERGAASIVGCIQVAISKPIGYMELLSVDRRLPKPQQALLVKALCYAAMGTIKRSGAVLSSGMVTFDDKSWKNILKRRGAVVLASGNKFVKRLV